MNKYEKQFEELVAGTLDPSKFDKQCSDDKCSSCSADSCPFKNNLKEKYFTTMLIDDMCSTKEEKETFENAIKNKDPEAIKILQEYIILKSKQNSLQ